MNITIRSETAQDAVVIGTVTELAFREVAHTDHTEQHVLAALRHSRALAVSLVALSGEIVVGHVAISPVSVSDGALDWYGLGPVSVLPDHQGLGIGSKLIKRALSELQLQGAAGCVVLGDPGYYARFGFQVVEGLIYPGVPPEYFQALSFNGGFARGEVSYHEAFSARA